MLSSKVFLFFVFIILIVLTINLAQESYKKYQLKKEISELKLEIDRLEGNKEQLSNLMEYFKNDSYLEQEARVKEQHTRGMLWDIYWIRSSQMEQRNQFVETVEKIAGGYKPELPASLDESDTKLNETYWALLAIPVHDGGMQPFSNEEIRSVQRLWIPYRDASAALFHALNPSVPPDIWKAWLTDMRSQQFQQVIDGGAK